MNHIGDSPTGEMYQSGLEIDCQCARCGSTCYSERCEACDDGYYDDEGEDGCGLVLCGECNGRVVFHRCMSSADWCKANPLPGREHIKRGQIEWFTTPEY